MALLGAALRYAALVPATVQRYVVDPADPRAPDDATWALLSEEERRRVVAMLPAEVPWELSPPEGDEHRTAREKAVDALSRFFRTTGRRVYISSELGIYYPAEPRFSPDVLAVLDVDPRPRNSWNVQVEGRGLDFVLEVHVAGDLAKDIEGNVDRYARLGIGEYFVFDKTHMRIHGYRLPPAERGKVRPGRAYDRIVPQMGRWSSEVLGIDLSLDSGDLRLMYGTAPIEQSEEIIERLGKFLNDVISHKEEDERKRQEAERERLEEVARAEKLETELADERRAREELERQVTELRELLARKSGPNGGS
jgi:hypothetical protein